MQALLASPRRRAGDAGRRLSAPAAGTRPAVAGGDAPACIIEMIGPPGCGKTTLALAAAEALGEAGVATRLVLSPRPGDPQAGSAARLRKLVAILMASASGRREPVGERLMRLMPVPGALAAARRRRYLAGLAAGRGDGVVVQDQGYLCAIAGLALDSGQVEAAALRRALELVPLPDLAIRVSVPADVVEARLRQRHAGLGRSGRLLERPATDNRRIEDILDRIEREFRQRDRRILHVAGGSREDLGRAVSAVVAAVLAAPRPGWRGAAQ
jgi:thymidylate kinase